MFKTITKLEESNNTLAIFTVIITSDRMVLSLFYIFLSDCNWKLSPH